MVATVNLDYDLKVNSPVTSFLWTISLKLDPFNCTTFDFPPYKEKTGENSAESERRSKQPVCMEQLDLSQGMSQIQFLLIWKY